MKLIKGESHSIKHNLKQPHIMIQSDLKLRHPRCVRYNKMVHVVESKTQLIRWWSILLLRQHVSALALGHHQVSICVLKETIQCSIYIAHNIQ
jgi:hypothetical protein